MRSHVGPHGLHHIARIARKSLVWEIRLAGYTAPLVPARKLHTRMPGSALESVDLVRSITVPL